MRSHDIYVIQAMQRLGGSFVKALAEAALHADPENLEKLKAAFPEMWTKYAELHRLSEKRG
jgi:hypothetical protein